jgi:hypothetical protein
MSISHMFPNVNPNDRNVGYTNSWRIRWCVGKYKLVERTQKGVLIRRGDNLQFFACRIISLAIH